MMAARSDEAATLEDLHLPPAFVADHAIRTLAYQGAISVLDLAKHWRVHDGVASEAVDALRAAGLVRSDTGPTDLDRLGRVRLTDAGTARLTAARERTWYAGPLPVALADLPAGADIRLCSDAGAVEAALCSIDVDSRAAATIGQAVAGGRTLALAGVAPDEQRLIAAAIGGALQGETTLPYAIFAGGAVIRVYDPQYHEPVTRESATAGATDVLRSHDGRRTPWTAVRAPSVMLAGGVAAADVVPAYDAEAHLYVAPPPCAAWGGVLSVLDSTADPAALTELATAWLLPAREGVGILKLRTGERAEIPWRAAVVLLNAEPAGLPGAARRAIDYAVDIGPLAGEALARFVARRLAGLSAADELAVALAGALERTQPMSRAGAAQAAQHLRDRAAYEGPRFRPTGETVREATDAARPVEATAQAPRRGSAAARAAARK